MKFLILTIFFLQVSSPSNDRNAAQHIKDGNRLYKGGQMAEAEQTYDKAINSQYKYTALVNKGNAQYRQKKFDEAIKTYKQAAVQGNDNVMMRSGAHYNAGVVYSSQKKIEDSIEEYKNALRLNWKDNKARENLQKALLELKKQTGGGGGGDEKNDESQQQSKSNISKSQAQQQLDRLEEKEKGTQEKVTHKKGQYGGSAGKDW